MSYSRSGKSTLLALFILFVALTGSASAQKQAAFPFDSLKPVFEKDFEKALYKGTLDIKKHHLTGLMLIKKFSDSSYRFVFNNEIGMKFLDLEFTAKAMIAHYCFPAMNKKAVMKLLETDFRILFFAMAVVKRAELLKTGDAEIVSFFVKKRDGKWIFTADEHKKLVSIDSKGKIIDKTRITLKPGKSQFPAGFHIENPTVGLVIGMNVLGN
jgi:hypothetical protein